MIKLEINNIHKEQAFNYFKLLCQFTLKKYRNGRYFQKKKKK